MYNVRNTAFFVTSTPPPSPTGSHQWGGRVPYYITKEVQGGVLVQESSDAIYAAYLSDDVGGGGKGAHSKTGCAIGGVSVARSLDEDLKAGMHMLWVRGHLGRVIIPQLDSHHGRRLWWCL